MSLCAEITVPGAETALGWVLRDLDVRVEFDPIVPTEDAYLPYLWVEGSQDTVDRFEDRIRGVEAVAGVSALQERDSRRLYWVDWESRSDGVFGAASRSDACVKRAIGTPEGWGLRLQGIDRTCLASFRDECAARSIPFTLQRLRSARPTIDTGTELTEPQRDALRLAYDEGYYDVPRDTTLERLGATLDVSRQAVSNRLRRGTKRLVEDVLLDAGNLFEDRLDAVTSGAVGEQRS